MLLYEDSYENYNVAIASEKLKNIINNKTIIACIGSDKILIDCLGPLVGTLLKDSIPNHIIGNLFNPILSTNIHELPKSDNMLIIDCCISDKPYHISIYDNPAYPGGLMQNKIPVGNCKIIAKITSPTSNIFNSTSLSHIYTMAVLISNTIVNSLKEK